MLVRLAETVPASDLPSRVAALVAWVRRLRREHPDGSEGPVLVHRSSDPGHWIVTFPWAMEDRAKALAESALALVEREVPFKVRYAPVAAGIAAGASRRAHEEATVAGPSYAGTGRPLRRLDQRHNGKTTTTRRTGAHPSRGRQAVGLPTSDGSSSTARWSNRATDGFAAHANPDPRDVAIAVLATARGGILLRGIV